MNAKGAQIMLYSDLSRRTLAKRRSLRPLTKVLVEGGITYNWIYLFTLRAFKNGRTYILQSPANLSVFMKNLDIPQMELEPWSDPSMTYLSELPQWEPWILVKRKERGKQYFIFIFIFYFLSP